MVFDQYCERRYSGQLNWHAREESLSLVLITAPLYIYPLLYIYFIYILHLFTDDTTTEILRIRKMTTTQTLTQSSSTLMGSSWRSSSLRAKHHQQRAVMRTKVSAQIGFGTDKKWLKTTIYPEWGSFPNSKEGVPSEWSNLTPEEYRKNADIEVIHGRWAMLAVSGVWAQENAGAGPWWEAGKECTIDSCKLTYAGFGDFKSSPTGALFGLIFIETLLLGGAEAYRTGLLENPFQDGLKQNDAYPGGRFDPFNYAEKEDLDLMKIRELKHGRLAMLAWLGILGQAVSTRAGAVSNATAHIGDVYHCNVFDRSGCGF